MKYANRVIRLETNVYEGESISEMDGYTYESDEEDKINSDDPPELNDSRNKKN